MTLREAEVELVQSQALIEVARKLEIAEYRWRKKKGELRFDQAQRLNQLERENSRVREAADGRGAA